MTEKKEYAVLFNNILKTFYMNSKKEKKATKSLLTFLETTFPNIRFSTIESKIKYLRSQGCKSCCLSHHNAVPDPTLIGLVF